MERPPKAPPLPAFRPAARSGLSRSPWTRLPSGVTQHRAPVSSDPGPHHQVCIVVTLAFGTGGLWGGTGYRKLRPWGGLDGTVTKQESRGTRIGARSRAPGGGGGEPDLSATTPSRL